MTKLQMKTQALALATEHKLNKAGIAALTELFEDFAKNANRDTVQRERNIQIKGVDYRWCMRHEVYEPLTNFKGKEVACMLAVKKWQYLGKMVKEAEAVREAAIEAEEFDKVKSLTEAFKEAKELRGGRYNLEDDQLQFPNIEGYQEDAGVKEDDVA